LLEIKTYRKSVHDVLNPDKYVIGHLPQHAGKAGTDTFWLSFPADTPPAWLSECGGTLTQAYEVLSKSLAK
jgi:hypothetical protein